MDAHGVCVSIREDAPLPHVFKEETLDTEEDEEGEEVGKGDGSHLCPSLPGGADLVVSAPELLVHADTLTHYVATLRTQPVGPCGLKFPPDAGLA